MAVKFYSDVTKKVYDNEDECKKAEEALTNRTAARKEDAEKVEVAHKQYVEARKIYENTLSEFCKKYGAYHKTITEKDLDELNWSVRDILKYFFI